MINKILSEWKEEMKAKLLAHQMDESCFSDYDDEDREFMNKLSELLYEKRAE